MMATNCLLNPHLGSSGFPFMKSIHFLALISLFSLVSRSSTGALDPRGMITAGSLACSLTFFVNSAALTPSTLESRALERR